MPFAAIWMDLEIIILRHRKKNISYMWKSKNNGYTLTYLQDRNRLTDIKTKLMGSKVDSGDRDKLGA